MTFPLTTLVDAMQAELHVAAISDYGAAHNGLQLANRSGQVGKVAAAVDASLPVIENVASTENVSAAVAMPCP